MKVLKFGGTSVGSVESILSLKSIVESQQDDCVVVVSALGGITDQLIRASRQALERGDSYQDCFLEMVKRHRDMVNTIIDYMVFTSSVTSVPKPWLRLSVTANVSVALLLPLS